MNREKQMIAGVDRDGLAESLVELIRRTTSKLPDDVIKRLKEYRTKEEPGKMACRTLDTIMENVDMAQSASRPICQDTGTVTFDIQHPLGARQSEIREIVKEAVVAATAKNYLRPNVVDSLTGEIKSDNIGVGHPVIHFEQWDNDYLEVTLVLKGGGCENVGAQYTLPQPALKAGRDINGVKKVVLDMVVKAQGKGCAPGVLGIAIGGDRAEGYAIAKKQLKRKLDDINPNPVLAELEGWVVEQANRLGVGPMGFGGKTTLFGAKATTLDRIPASYFVSISYMCWAYRRRTMTIRNGEVQHD